MITRLSLKNFQAWASVDLPLSPITVIIGETNAGKSSLLRGLACVLFNAFEGQGMVRQGATMAEVTLDTETDKITWSRGNGVNRYTLNDQIFDKPGRIVPPPIQAALEIHELEFDGETVRLQWAPQMDAPFLLSDSGAKATRMLGVAGNAAVVAQATRLAQQETKSQQDALKAATGQLEALTTQLTGYADVEMAEPMARALRNVLAEKDRVSARRRVLTELHDIQSETIPRKHELTTQLAQATVLAATLRAFIDGRVEQEDLTAGMGLWIQKAALEARLGKAQRLVATWQQMVRLEEIRTVLREAGDVQTQVAAVRQRWEAAELERRSLADLHAALTIQLTCPVCGRVKDVA